MKIVKHIPLLFLLFYFISCGNPIELYNLKCTVDKEEYKVDEEIQISFTGNFTPRDKIRSYSFWVTLLRFEENTAEYGPKEFDVSCVNGEAYTPESEYYQELFDSYKNLGIGSFQFGRQINENVLKIDDKMVIKVSEPGTYRLDVEYNLEPNWGPLIGDSKTLHINFTVTE